MQLRVFNRPWSMRTGYAEIFKRIRQEGYDGIEHNVPEKRDASLFTSLLQDYDFPYIADIRTPPGAGAAEALESFKRQVDEAAAFSPVMVNCQTGRDCMPFAEQCRFMEKALAIEAKYPFKVGHETHRKRFTFTPWSTLALLEELPGISLTADYSHWCCVTETMLEDHLPVMARVAANVIHIHSRVGYQQGPQVPHPGAPEYAYALEAHEAWWAMVVRRSLLAGKEMFTTTPEYGHAGNRYMHTLPYTNAHVADDREVCAWAAGRFRIFYAETLESLLYGK